MAPQQPHVGQPRHYEELGVPPTATTAEIRAAYVALARRHHPDRMNGSPAPEQARAAARMAAINAAWTVLSDPGRRAAYDARHDLSSSRSSAHVRDPGGAFRPLDDSDDVDPRLLDDTPTGAPTLPRALAFIPTGLAAVGAAFVVLGALLGLGGMLIGGFFVLACAGLAFLALPFAALISASRADRE